MKRLSDLITTFTRGIARSHISLIGAMIVTIIFPFLCGALIYDVTVHIDNTYAAAIIYMVLGPAFIFGLVMVFLGLTFFKGKEEVRLFTLEYLRDYFTDPSKFGKLRKLVFFAVFLTCINFFIFSLLAYRGYHYLESVGFCGQFCHTVMAPEFTAYSNSPHSRVTCVECHIGSGAQWFVKSKISGMRQLLAVALQEYPTPIETPVHGLRPARDTCEECHRPEKFHGNMLRVRDKFLTDEASTNVKTVLMMKIGSAGDRTTSSHGIHWHVAPENRITYKATDHSRTVIPEVTLHQKDGTKVVFRTDDAEEQLAQAGETVETREMDCIDCHNRPTHIYLGAEEALDQKILDGKIPRDLPFIKREGLRLITEDYPDQDEARTAIASGLHAWYQKNYPDLANKQAVLVKQAIQGVQDAYLENVFPSMKVGWGTYVDHIGHGEDFDIGCARCHDDMHNTTAGQSISADCNTCHSILAENEENPQILETLEGD